MSEVLGPKASPAEVAMKEQEARFLVLSFSRRVSETLRLPLTD
jgi:hypothetical protein